MNTQPSSQWIVTFRLTVLIAAVALAAMLLLMSRAPMLIWLKLGVAIAAILFGSFAVVGHIAERRAVIAWSFARGIVLGTIGFTVAAVVGFEHSLARSGSRTES